MSYLLLYSAINEFTYTDRYDFRSTTEDSIIADDADGISNFHFVVTTGKYYLIRRV